jgi:2-polyprenyl-3-methyl-5-hydroxy-6-metoxy-1,4-benzoquinol methylase
MAWTSRLNLNSIIARYKFILPYLNNKKVLEVGCGFGIGASIIHDKALLYRGIDVSKKNIILAKKQNIKIQNLFLNMSAYDIKKLNIKFDLIICLATMYYLNFDKFLKCCCYVLKKNGQLIFDMTNVNIIGLNKKWDNQTKYLQILDMQKMLIKNGFKKNTFFGSDLEYKKNKTKIIVLKLRMLFKFMLSSKYLSKLKRLILFFVERNFFKIPAYLIKNDFRMSKKKNKIIEYKKIEKYKNNYSSWNIFIVSKYL